MLGRRGLMTNQNEIQNSQMDDIDFEEIEKMVLKELEDQFSELELLEEERKMISNPDSLVKIVMDEVWNQFGNQIGLDITDQTLIEKYDDTNPEDYKTIGKKVMQDQRYREANKSMKEKKLAGELTDTYTGRKIKRNETPHLDHVVSRKEIFYNQRRKQANLSVESLANAPENLKPTNESLNTSMKETSIEDYLATYDMRKQDWHKLYDKRIKKIDESDLPDLEKRLQKQKLKKQLDDKLAADKDLMLKVDKEARKPMNKKIFKGATKEIGKKAGKDALKYVAITSLATLLKEVMNGLVRFLTAKKKSHSHFLAEMKRAIKSFFAKILRVIQSGTTVMLGTIVSEIFGPIVSMFRKLASIIKQGFLSIREAINYIRNKDNKDKPLSVKISQVGKIISVGLMGGSAILLGEVFEKVLLNVPGMQIHIPILGSLANMIGLFLSSLLSGVIGAIILNFINTFISRKLNEESSKKLIKKKNEILQLQDVQTVAVEGNVAAVKKNVIEEISQNHHLAKEEMQKSLEKIFDETDAKLIEKDEKMITENQSKLTQIEKQLDELLGSES